MLSVASFMIKKKVFWFLSCFSSMYSTILIVYRADICMTNAKSIKGKKVLKISLKNYNDLAPKVIHIIKNDSFRKIRSRLQRYTID